MSTRSIVPHSSAACLPAPATTATGLSASASIFLVTLEKLPQKSASDLPSPLGVHVSIIRGAMMISASGSAKIPSKDPENSLPMAPSCTAIARKSKEPAHSVAAATSVQARRPSRLPSG